MARREAWGGEAGEVCAAEGKEKAGRDRVDTRAPAGGGLSADRVSRTCIQAWPSPPRMHRSAGSSNGAERLRRAGNSR